MTHRNTSALNDDAATALLLWLQVKLNLVKAVWFFVDHTGWNISNAKKLVLKEVLIGKVTNEMGFSLAGEW